MGTYGTASGLVIVTPSLGEPGKLLGLRDGELQAYFDRDGKIKWGGGIGTLDSTGARVEAGPGIGLGPYAYEFAISGAPIGGMYGIYNASDAQYVVVRANSQDLDNYAILEAVRDRVENDYAKHARVIAKTENDGSDATLTLVAKSGTRVSLTLAAAAGKITASHELDMSSAKITSLADAVNATDGLNQQSGDARYAPIAGAHAAVTLATDAQAILNLSTQEVGLVAQPANRVFAGPASGADADPTMRALAAADLPAASESAQGAVELATVAEAATGTDTSRAVTPAGLPLRVVGNGWALKEVSGSAPEGDARGQGAVDLQTTRIATTQVASGVGAVIIGGQNNTASGAGAVALGDAAIAANPNQLAQASGYFAAAGDAQRGVYVLRVTTTDATPVVLDFTVDGRPGNNNDLTIADDTVWNFRAEIVALTADAADYASYTVTGLVRRANGTVTVHGVTTTTHAESAAGWDATALADDTNKALSIQVTGAAGATIRWTAAVYTTEVSFPS